ncbi:Sensor histidine kinase DesK [Streptomyces sp. YIM 121038]|uniref:sensor histidine kinase n=1 Tax=Streptomyces sp. YIM 121038 TaxID=2136401 RepID=UPI00116514C1|nr:sensor histidine kinase [Streptomyces sp. YIM 121038]QCX79160.1 Sensor histidine kinase DesK [Streptomyces sp. YIM 121038]
MLARSHPPRPGARRPSRRDVQVALGALVLDLTAYALNTGADGESWRPDVVALHLLFPLFLVWHRRHPLAALAGLLLTVTAIACVSPGPYGQPVSLLIALFAVALERPLRVALAAGVVTFIGLQVPGVSEDEPWVRAVIGDAVAVGMAVVGGCAARQWQRQLAVHRELLAAGAVAAERRRIARELHDVVAHHITAMQLMAGGARKVVQHDVALAQDALKSLEDSGRLALSEMRQLLDVLRTDDDTEGRPAAPQPDVTDLPRVIAESRQAGVDTELLVDGVRQELAPTLGLTVFRIVQEALTNIRKHALGARATVYLDYGPELLTVEIRDDGSGSAAAPRKGRAGHGLVGMRERVALHGGTLETGPRPEGGFRVLATLPLPAGEQAPTSHERATVR